MEVRQLTAGSALGLRDRHVVLYSAIYGVRHLLASVRHDMRVLHLVQTDPSDYLEGIRARMK